MEGTVDTRRRAVVVVILAVLVLLGLALATGTNPFAGLSSPSQAPAPTAPPPVPTEGNDVKLRGRVTVRVKRLNPTTWLFAYTLRNAGTAPIAGFQLNGPTANLFHVRANPAWQFFEIDASHSPNITAPETLAKLIDRIAK